MHIMAAGITMLVQAITVCVRGWQSARVGRGERGREGGRERREGGVSTYHDAPLLQA